MGDINGQSASSTSLKPVYFSSFSVHPIQSSLSRDFGLATELWFCCLDTVSDEDYVWTGCLLASRISTRFTYRPSLLSPSPSNLKKGSKFLLLNERKWKAYFNFKLRLLMLISFALSFCCDLLLVGHHGYSCARASKRAPLTLCDLRLINCANFISKAVMV